MGNLQEKTFHTKNSVSKNQYSTFGEIKFMTRDKATENTREKGGLDMEQFEKTLTASAKAAGSGQSEEFNVPNSPAQLVMKLEEKEALKNTTNPLTHIQPDAGKSLVVDAFMDIKTRMVEEISTIFDKKLEKLDNAVIELIDCKTENERLKSKIDNLIKENYKLKKELFSYKPLVPGVFIKSRKDEFNL